MELHARIFILCILCIASEVSPVEIAEFGATPLTLEDLSRIPVQNNLTDGLDGQSTESPRDKRALGLLLSGLAQIFGYTVTPVQFASLPNPNTTRPAATSSKTANVTQQTASSRPANITMPKQQETIRFTGVLNFGNNSDIVGHLQRYEQIFHGRRNNTAGNMMTMSRPPMMPPAKISMALTDSQSRPPLLAPFFVKIPLPIAPNLLPVEDLESPPVSVTSDSNESVETPVRKEQEMIYRNNEDTERYMVEKKEIYDEKDVRKPADNPQLYVDEPSWNKQQNDRRNELQRKQEERIKKLEQQEEERNHDKGGRYNEEEINERYRNREEAIANRNREHSSRHESTERRKPTYNSGEDEDSAERSREYTSQENLSNESSKQSSKNEKEQSEDYPIYDDDSNRYKQPKDFDKYVYDVRYNQQLPIGDYFHEGNPEVIRDSYGEVLNNKRLEDDRITGYLSMFKHPYIQANVYDSQRARHPEDTSREENGKESSIDDGYDEHLVRLQKLREEYASPENKYEEYELIDENERKNERIQNRTSAESERPKTESRDKEDDRARLENAGRESQEIADFARYMPLVVPVRYIDVNDKAQEATVRQLHYKEEDKSTDSRFGEDNAVPARTILNENLVPQIGLPEGPRPLYESKELVWPPSYDYAYGNAEPTANSVIPPNLRNYYPQTYAPNYYQHVVKEVATQDASGKASDQPSGYLVVLGNSIYPYQYPYNVYYVSNEAVNPRDQIPHPNAEVTKRPRDEKVYVAQQSAGQEIVPTSVRPNITEYNLNKTANGPRDYYYQSQEIPTGIFDHYKSFFGERNSQVKEPLNIEIRSQIPKVRNSVENWSNRLYRPQSPSDTTEQSPRPVFTQLQNIAPSNRNAQSRQSSERSRRSRLLGRQKSLRPEDRREDNEKAEKQSIPKDKPFDDPQSAHDFFGFSKDDYNFGSESSDAMKVIVAEGNGKTAEESGMLAVPEPIAHHHDDESIAKLTDEPENSTEKAKVREYRNKVMTLRVSEQRQLQPNGPIHYVDYVQNL